MLSIGIYRFYIPHIYYLLPFLTHFKTAFNNVEAPPAYDADTNDVVAHPMAHPVAVVHPVAMPPVTQAPSMSAYVLPNDLNFTPSINGRNGWNFESFYEISEEVSP